MAFHWKSVESKNANDVKLVSGNDKMYGERNHQIAIVLGRLRCAIRNFVKTLRETVSASLKPAMLERHEC